MGKQSSRIYFQKKDHKDIYMNGHYHSAVYLCKESEDGQVNCELIWRKIFDENLYIHQTLPNGDNPSISQNMSLTVNMDEKRIYLTPVWTNRDNEKNYITYNPDWIDGKEYVSILTDTVGSKNAAVYKNKELIFNDVFQVNDQLLINGISLHCGDYPSRAVFSDSINVLTIKKVIMKESKTTIDTVTCYLQNHINLQGYKAFLFRGYNNSKYFYVLAKSNENCILIQSDIDGNIKILKLDNFDSTSRDVYVNSPIIMAAKEEKVYLLATKVIEDENTDSFFIVNSITVIDGMKIVSTEEIDSWSEKRGESSAYKGKLIASVYSPTVSPMTFIYSRYGVRAQYAKSLLITIDENEISTGDISTNNFSFFVNLYENGEIVDTITVSTKYDCTDMKNGIIWLYELAGYLLANATESVFGVLLKYFNDFIHYTKNGWVEGGTHGVFYDESTQYFYTFYIKHLYPSGENFFIRFKTEED